MRKPCKSTNDVNKKLMLYLKFLYFLSEAFISSKCLLLTGFFYLTDEDPQDGKLKRLPQSLSESVNALEKDSALEKLIGEKLILAVKGVRKVRLINLFYVYVCSLKNKIAFFEIY